MSTATSDGVTLYYETHGDPEQPTVAFLPDTATGPWLWSWQAPGLTGPYQTLIYAQRGTDGSDNGGPYNVQRLAADLDAVLTDAGVDRVHLVGAGLGAMTALRYAREYGRARSLTLFGAAADGDRIDREALGTLHPADPNRFRESLSFGFSDGFLAETGMVDDIVDWRREEDATGDARSGHLDAALGFEAEPLYELTLPTLVCHGVDDPVVPLETGGQLAEDLPRGRFEAVEGKRWCFVEHSAAVNDVVDEFIDNIES